MPKEYSAFAGGRMASLAQVSLLGLAAVCFASGGYFMKLSAGLTQPAPTLAVFGLFLLGAALQTLGMRHAALSSAYIVVLGLEAVAALVLGRWWLGEPLGGLKLAGVALVVAGVGVLRLAEAPGP